MYATARETADFNEIKFLLSIIEIIYLNTELLPWADAISQCLEAGGAPASNIEALTISGVDNVWINQYAVMAYNLGAIGKTVLVIILKCTEKK